MVAISAGSSIEPLLCMWRSWHSWRSHTVLLCIDTANELVCISSGDAIIVAERYRRRPIRKKGRFLVQCARTSGAKYAAEDHLGQPGEESQADYVIWSYSGTGGVHDCLMWYVGTREREGPEIWRSGESNYM